MSPPQQTLFLKLCDKVLIYQKNGLQVQEKKSRQKESVKNNKGVKHDLMAALSPSVLCLVTSRQDRQETGSV